jgi:ferredoxin-NADP reductase
MNPTLIPPKPTSLGRRLLRSRLFESIISPNGIDGYGELIDPTFSVRDVRGEIVEIRRQTSRSVTLVIKPNKNWQGFSAGQHVGTIVEVDGVLNTRFYSPASSDTNNSAIELTVSLHEGGAVSSRLLKAAKVGMVVGLTPAEGEFVLPQVRPERLLLVAGGSGITPLMSMLRTLVDQGHRGEVTLIRISRTPEDALYETELTELAAAHTNFKFVRAYTRERVDGALHGHLTKAKLNSACKDFADAATYVCGPSALTEAAETIWQKQDAAARLKVESFKLPEPVISSEDATGTLGFSVSGVAVDNDGRPLLDQAEEAGLTPRCGCRMGICHTCIAHVEEGVIRDVRTGEVRTVKDEYIQTCVNAPVGQFEIEL